MTGGAVHVFDRTARAADQVVMVVAGPPLEQGRRSGRFDPADQPCPHKSGEDVVHPLRGHRTDPFPDGARNGVSTDVTQLAENPQDGDPRRRDPQPRGPQLVGGFRGGHATSQARLS